MDSIISQQEAKSSGLATYFDGEFCSNGHMVDKYTNSGKCVACCKDNLNFLAENLNTKKLKVGIGKKLRRLNRAEKFANFILDDKKHLKYIRKALSAHKARSWLQESQQEEVVLPVDILSIFKAQNGECAACFADFNEVGYEIEHIIPLTAFGIHKKENIQLLCMPCNRRKHNKSNEYWLGALRTQQVLQYLEYLSSEGY